MHGEVLEHVAARLVLGESLSPLLLLRLGYLLLDLLLWRLAAHAKTLALWNSLMLDLALLLLSVDLKGVKALGWLVVRLADWLLRLLLSFHIHF